MNIWFLRFFAPGGCTNVQFLKKFVVLNFRKSFLRLSLHMIVSLRHLLVETRKSSLLEPQAMVIWKNKQAWHA
jgi:hypothetical protein